LDLVSALRATPLQVPEVPVVPFLRGERGETGINWTGHPGCLPFCEQPPFDVSSVVSEIDKDTVSTIAEYLRINPAGLDKSLPQWLLEDVFGAESWDKVPNMHPELWNLVNDWKDPPLARAGGHAAAVVEVWSPGDNHFTKSFDPNGNAARYDMKVPEDSGRPFYALISMLPCMNAEEIVFGTGGKATPTNLIGLALNQAPAKHENSPLLDPFKYNG
jgi:hypothetical protein